MALLIQVTQHSVIYEHEVKITAIRAQGPGGQHVNKTATAILLQLDVTMCSLSASNKQAILNYNDYRISRDGLISIKAQRYRSQEQNRNDAIARLESLIKKALITKKKRVPTKPSKSSIEKRLSRKKSKGKVKNMRRKPPQDE